MVRPILYVDNLSPPAQACSLLVRLAGLDVEIKEIQLSAGDHMKPEFVKKFPLHAVPALEDNGFYLWDSHAICTYLVSAYAKDDTLYPKDPKKKAKVDQWLHFSNSILYNRLRDMSEPLFLGQRKDVPEEKKQRVTAACKNLEELLGDKKWLCGDQMTLADLCCVCEVVGSTVLGDSISQFKTLQAWVERCQAALPGYKEIALDGLEKYGRLLKTFMS